MDEFAVQFLVTFCSTHWSAKKKSRFNSFTRKLHDECGTTVSSEARPVENVMSVSLSRSKSVWVQLTGCQSLGSWHWEQWLISSEWSSTWTVMFWKPNLLESSSVASWSTDWVSATSSDGETETVRIFYLCLWQCRWDIVDRNKGEHFHQKKNMKFISGIF